MTKIIHNNSNIIIWTKNNEGYYELNIFRINIMVKNGFKWWGNNQQQHYIFDDQREEKWVNEVTP